MTVTPKALVASKTIENTMTDQYTATNLKAIIEAVTVTNITGTAAVLNVEIDGVNHIKDRTLQPSQTLALNALSGHVLEANSVLSMSADTASALTTRVSGVEVT